MTINIEKTCYIILKNPQNTFQFRHDLLKLKDSNLTYANEVKFLGVILDEHLNWHAHINFLANQLRPIAGLLYRVSSCLPMDVLLLIYNSFVNSKLSYCIEIWGNAS